MDCNIILHYHSLHSLIFSCSDHPVASLLLDWFLLNLIGSLLWIQARCLGSFQKQFHQFALTQSSLCVVSVFIQKFMEHISLCGKCPLTLLQIVLCHHSKSYFKQSSTQIIYQSSMLQDLSLQDLSHCSDPEYCYTQFIKWKCSLTYQQILIIITQDNISSVEVSSIWNPFFNCFALLEVFTHFLTKSTALINQAINTVKFADPKRFSPHDVITLNLCSRDARLAKGGRTVGVSHHFSCPYYWLLCCDIALIIGLLLGDLLSYLTFDWHCLSLLVTSFD